MGVGDALDLIFVQYKYEFSKSVMFNGGLVKRKYLNLWLSVSIGS